MDGNAGPSNLLDGDFVGGTQLSLNRAGERAMLKLSPDSNAFPWNFGAGFGGFLWNIHMRPGIPLDFQFQTGAGESQLDFSNLIVHSIVLETGASLNPGHPTRCGRIHKMRHSIRGSLDRGAYSPGCGRANSDLQGGLMGENIDKNRFPFNGTNV